MTTTLTPTATTPRQTFTVLGYWDDSSSAIAVGVVAGEHQVGGGDAAEAIWEGGLWSTSVEAETMEEAEDAAIADMEGTLADDDEG